MFPFLIFTCARNTGTTTKAVDYIDPDAAAVIKINHLSSFLDSLQNNEFLSLWEPTAPYQKMVRSSAFLKHLDSSAQGVLVLSKSKNDTTDFLYVSKNLNNIFGTDSLRANYAQNPEVSINDVTNYIVEDVPLFCRVDDQFLLVASSPETLENALYQKQQRTDTVFKKLFEISDMEKPASILINAQQYNPVFSHVLKEKDSTLLSNLSDWISFDMDIHANSLLLNGLSVHQDSSKRFLNLFRNTRPLPHTITSFAPITTNAILSFSFDNFAIFAENLQQYTASSKPIDSLFSAVEEIGLINIDKQQAVILNTYGSETMADYLGSIRKEVTDYQGTTLFALSKTDFLNTAFRPLINDFQARYATILENAFVFTETKETIQRIIGSYKRDATFDKGSLYKLLGKTTASAASIWYIADDREASNLAKDHLAPPLFQKLKTPKLSGYAYAAQVVSDGDLFHTSITIQNRTASTEEIGIRPLFTTKLESAIASTPQFTINHTNNRKEIVVQDQKNNLYLISSNGNIRWKKQLDSRIQGKIHQVDLFKNNRLQFAFTTSNKLWVLDRNGKEVAMLCKDFTGGEGELSPLAVFDYDKNSEYRFVLTQGTKIFMYDRKGKIVKGFKYTESKTPVVAAPKHIVIGKKDHLVFKLQDGTLKILNRRGEVRVKVSQKIAFSENEVYRHQNRFCITDKKGTLCQIGQNGKLTSTDLGLPPDHGIAATQNTFVSISDDVLTINDTEVLLELGVYTAPKIFEINKEIFIGVTDLQNKKVYLFSLRGEPMAGFPIEGIAVPDLSDIDGDQRLDMVTQKADSTLITYKIN